MRTIFVVNNDISFLTHRAVWALALQSAGGTIRVIAEDTGYGAAIRHLGFEFIPVTLGREFISPWVAARSAMTLFIQTLKFRPQLVMLSATTAYSLGWLAAPLLPRTRFVRVAGGVGRALSEHNTRRVARLFIKLALRTAGRLRNVHTLFQTDSDRAFFLLRRLAQPQRSTVIAGTGVDMSEWRPASERSDGALRILFASRLSREKGIYDFIAVARGRAHHPGHHRFIVVGSPDTGVSSGASPDELRRWAAEGVVEYWGHRDNMVEVHQLADIFVFPSTHPEGTPKVIIEAAACGVPVVTYETPGCVAVVEHRLTGIVVPRGDQSALGAAVDELANSPELRTRMSMAARGRAESLYSLERVLAQLFDFLEITLDNEGSPLSTEVGN